MSSTTLDMRATMRLALQAALQADESVADANPLKSSTTIASPPPLSRRALPDPNALGVPLEGELPSYEPPTLSLAAVAPGAVSRSASVHVWEDSARPQNPPPPFVGETGSTPFHSAAEEKVKLYNEARRQAQQVPGNTWASTSTTTEELLEKQSTMFAAYSAQHSAAKPVDSFLSEKALQELADFESRKKGDFSVSDDASIPSTEASSEAADDVDFAEFLNMEEFENDTDDEDVMRDVDMNHDAAPPPNPYTDTATLHLVHQLVQQEYDIKYNPTATSSPPKQEPESNAIPAFVRAKYAFTAIANGDLTFSKGDIITILGVARDDKWYIGSLGSAGKVGFVPSNFCEEYPPLEKEEPSQDDPHQIEVDIDETPRAAPLGTGTNSTLAEEPRVFFVPPETDPAGTKALANAVYEFKERQKTPPPSRSVSSVSESNASSTSFFTAFDPEAPIQAGSTWSQLDRTLAERGEMSALQVLRFRSSDEDDEDLNSVDDQMENLQFDQFDGVLSAVPTSTNTFDLSAPNPPWPTLSTRMEQPGEPPRLVARPLPPSDQFKVKALYPYARNDATELSFLAGEVIKTLGLTDSGWWFGELKGVRGLFPSNYCSLYEEEEPKRDEPISRPRDPSIREGKRPERVEPDIRVDAGPSNFVAPPSMPPPTRPIVKPAAPRPPRPPKEEIKPDAILPHDWTLEDDFQYEDGRWHCTHPTCVTANAKEGRTRFYGIYTASRTMTSGIAKRAREHAAKHRAKEKRKPTFNPYPSSSARDNRQSSTTSIPSSEVIETPPTSEVATGWTNSETHAWRNGTATLDANPPPSFAESSPSPFYPIPPFERLPYNPYTGEKQEFTGSSFSSVESFVGPPSSQSSWQGSGWRQDAFENSDSVHSGSTIRALQSSAGARIDPELFRILLESLSNKTGGPRAA